MSQGSAAPAVEVANQAEGTPRAGGGRRLLFLLQGLIVVWTLLMRQFGGADVYGVMGPYALTVVTMVWLLRGRKVRDWFAPTRLAILTGLLVGVVMTAATYPAFRIAVSIMPWLDQQVQGLYAASRTTSLPVAMAWVTVIIVAEELLWRGLLLEVLDKRVPRGLDVGLSVLTYALAQLGSGSWVVFALAAVCGSLWSMQRRLTHSLLSPLISHMIWTHTVILLWPVT